MKIYNLGSVNIDFVYTLDDFVSPGETVECSGFAKFAGGKGFNQSTALARAGADVTHIGAVGSDGAWLVQTLARDGADVSRIGALDGLPTGHAIIQVDRNGGNCIIIAPGANGAVSETMVEEALSGAAPGDWLLAQNETSAIAYAIRAAKSRGMRVALNPAPMNDRAKQLPLDLVDMLIVNETEADSLAENARPSFGTLREKFPHMTIVLTLGNKGLLAAEPGCAPLRCDVFPAKVVDSTAAGDCFTGYLLAETVRGATFAEALRTATVAAGISVSRHGASPSVPRIGEVRKELAAWQKW